MTTLQIKDLSVTEALDARAMRAVRGGNGKENVPAHMLPYFGESKYDFKFDVSQLIGQTQNVVNNNGNNVAFSYDIHSTIKPTQTANNNISF